MGAEPLDHAPHATGEASIAEGIELVLASVPGTIAEAPTFVTNDGKWKPPPRAPAMVGNGKIDAWLGKFRVGRPVLMIETWLGKVIALLGKCIVLSGVIPGASGTFVFVGLAADVVAEFAEVFAWAAADFAEVLAWAVAAACPAWVCDAFPVLACREKAAGALALLA